MVLEVPIVTCFCDGEQLDLELGLCDSVRASRLWIFLLPEGIYICWGWGCSLWWLGLGAWSYDVVQTEPAQQPMHEQTLAAVRERWMISM